MKTLAKNMLGILILCLLISGCCKPCPEPVIKITKVYNYVQCPKPSEPVYGEFNEELHVGHLGNLEMMRGNLESALRYNDSIENVIRCYENQVKETSDETSF